MTTMTMSGQERTEFHVHAQLCRTLLLFRLLDVVVVCVMLLVSFSHALHVAVVVVLHVFGTDRLVVD